MSEKGVVRVAMIGAGRMANNVHYPSLVSFGVKIDHTGGDALPAQNHARR
ncbi:MAG: hypothetical protein HY332_14625 [Chloroflexi bacterium]|nr:hypothetical protein [Chloroflexota bacterium]